MAVADTRPPGASIDVTERIERLTAGEPDAKEWIYRRFSPTLYRRIQRRFGADRNLDSEELLHDLFVWCFQNDGKILSAFVARNSPENRTEFRLEGYLWGLVSGLVSNQRRARRRGTEPVPLESLGEPSGDDAAVSEIERDTLNRLSDCLRERGTRLFLYFVLRFVEGLTPGEVLGVTGWTRPKVYKMKTALNGAIDRCLERLGL